MSTNPLPLDRRSLSDEIYAQLRTRILTGSYQPGEKLLEPGIADAFGVSRGPVREALRMLVAEGLARQEPRKGVRVPWFDADLWRELSELREALESAAARLAALRGTDEAIANISWLLSRAGDVINSTEGRGYPNEFDLHAAIAQAAGNTSLAEKIQETSTRLHLARLLSGMSHERVSPAYEEHLEIVRAIEARDPDRAEKAMRAHLQRAFEHMRAMAAPKGG
jgi:DNA-binding GntR family transcriptional regulator